MGWRFVWVLGFVTCSLQAARSPQLSETGLYSDLAAKMIAPQNLSFSPQYPLWTDGASKQRWIYLPPGTQIDTTDIDHWTFPVGTKIWKEFSFPHASGTGKKRVETRLAEKLPTQGWEFSTYAWNEEETAAPLAPLAGVRDAYPSGLGTTHDIPSVSSCLRCHNRGGDRVLGFDALQLSEERDSMALHAEPLVPGMVTLKSLAQSSLLTVPPSNFVPKIHASSSLGRTAMGYLHANCGSCHNPSGNAQFTGLFFRHSVLSTSEVTAPTFATAVNQMTTGFWLPNEAESFRIKAGEPEKSAVVYRLKATDFDRMPPVGSKFNDQDAIKLIEEWIKTM